jgi:hypothetical protein
MTSLKKILEDRGLVEGIDFKFGNYNDPKYRSTKYGLNPKIPAPADRPVCAEDGCNRPKAIISTLKDGSPNYRKVCAYHHEKNICKANGVRYREELTAKRQGVSVTELKNRSHKYRKHRLDYCENIDGRLGYTCSAHIPIKAVLQVDHIDGDPHNHDPDNLQTLCANCHTYKTNINKDAKTPGRKSKSTAEYAMRGLA